MVLAKIVHIANVNRIVFASAILLDGIGRECTQSHRMPAKRQTAIDWRVEQNWQTDC